MILAWIVTLLVLGLGAAAVWYFSRHNFRFAAIALGAVLIVVAVSALLGGSDLALQKLISYAIMPSGLLWLGLGALAVHAFARQEKRIAVFALLLFGLHGTCGNSWIASFAMRAHEDSVKTYSIDGAPHLDAVLVLGGGAIYNEHGEAALSDNGDRVMAAARLFLAKKVDFLVTSGSSIAALHSLQDPTAATSTIWTDLGIPERNIARISEPKNTSQEVSAFARLAKTRGWKKLGVLSSAFHLPRILRLCEKEGLEVAAIASDHRGGVPEPHPTFLIPQPGAWRNSQNLVWEIVGRLAGR